ncbi:unnamed protein product [Orchesella dallaii]|uniref:BTB domain-containing protein n=1 Tax=Orchesella dallaii TaxID=48710 RepID=A0ABP1RMM3_9HEXA
MALPRKKIYLLKDAVKELTIAAQGDKNTSREESALLYEGKIGQLKHYPGENYDSKQLRAIQRVYEDATRYLLQPRHPLPPGSVRSINGPCSQLELWISYDTFCESFKIHAKLRLGESFITSILKVLEAPTISFSGTFTANYTEGQSIENNSGREISVSGMSLKDAYHYIRGITAMEEFCNKATHGTEISLKYSITLEWKSAKKEFHAPSVSELSVNVLEKLLIDKIFADCCIVASNGEEVSCHRNVLAAQSDVLHTMLTSGFQESQSGRIEMMDVSEVGVKVLLNYFYQNVLDMEGITEDVAFELLNAAHKYNVKALEKMMAEILFKKPAEWFTLSNVLALYFFTVKVEEYETLCEKMMAILKKNSKELRSVAAYQDLMEKNPKEAFELAFKLLEL